MFVLKAVGPPGSLTFLALGVALGFICIRVWPRNRRLGRSWLAVLFGLYVLMGLPLVANAVADRLTQFRPHTDLSGIARMDSVIVLDGDNRRGRVRETREFYAAAAPEVVMVSGEDWLRAALVEAGIPPQQIVHETGSANTRDQVVEISQFIASRPGQTAVVASRLQMPRLSALLQVAAIPVVLIASPVDIEPPTRGPRLLVPTYSALRLTRDALYEHAAIRYYQWRGWIPSG